jgi:uncharacterized protein (TIGR03067 family)
MNRTIGISGMLLTFGLTLTAATQAGGKSDLDRLQGTWETVKVTVEGKEIPAEGKKTLLVFKANKLTITNVGAPGAELTIALDETNKPKTLTTFVGKKKEMTIIYRLEGDTLTLAMPKPGSPAPTSFDAKDALVLTLKRAKPAPDADRGAVEPFLDEHTQLAIGINFHKLDAKAAMVKIHSVLDLPTFAEHLALAKQQDAPTQSALKAGARRQYAVIRKSKEGMQGFTLITLSKDADVERVVAALRAFAGGTEKHVHEKIGSVLYMGPKESLTAVRAIKPRARPDVAQALAAAEDTTLQLHLFRADFLLETLGSLLKLDPKEGLGKALKVFQAKGRWASLGIDIGPELRLRFAVQGRDAEAAKDLEAVLGELLKKLGELPLGTGPFGVNPAKVAQKWLTPKRVGDRLVLALDDAQLTTLLRPVLREYRRPKDRDNALFNYRHIAAALLTHHAQKGGMPAAIYSKDGKPLLSWRVAILPYLKYSVGEQLYREFKLDEPWDSPHNLKLLKWMPLIYAPAGVKTKEPYTTFCQVFVGPGTAFEPGKTLLLDKDFPDGTALTILLAEAGTAVPWTKPDDLPYDPKADLPKLGGLHPDGFPIAMCNGSVRWVSRPFDVRTFRLAVTRNDGQKIDLYRLGKDR